MSGLKWLLLAALASLPILRAEETMEEMYFPTAASIRTFSSLRSDATSSTGARGKVGVSALGFGVNQLLYQDGASIVHLGLAANLLLVDTAGDAPVPSTLRGFNLSLLWRRTFTPAWRGYWEIAPGFNNDGHSSATSGFRVSNTLGLSYNATKNVTLFGGIYVNPFNRTKVFPGLGVQWHCTEKWTIGIGIPRTEIAYRWNPYAVSKFGIDYRNATYDVSDPSLIPSGLSHTKLSYIEGRVGERTTVKLSQRWSIEGGTGWVFYRSFYYYRRHYEIKPDGSFFADLSLTAQF